MDAAAVIAEGVRAIESLAPAMAEAVRRNGEVVADARRAEARGYLNPQEDERLRLWFARYLTARDGLLATIRGVQPVAGGTIPDVTERQSLEAFVIAYTAATVLVRGARFLMDTLATHKAIQRKLNEPEPRFRIPRKQYTEIRRSLSSIRNAWRLREARQFADRHRAAIDGLSSDRVVGSVVECLHDAEGSIGLGRRKIIVDRLRYAWHSMRRRRASAAQQATFVLAEGFARSVGEWHSLWHVPKLPEDVFRKLADLLEPGDVIATRRETRMSNLLLPGFWPHVALYVGHDVARDALGVKVDPARASRWSGDACVLEARRDGVRFRPLAETLAVDAVAVIRPLLEREQIGRALTQAVSHEGKLYNFDFDFFRADRLVCTEVVYRAYDGVGDLTIDLTHRAGRPTLSAEDLLDLAMNRQGFEPVAAFCPGRIDDLVTGEASARALAGTYWPSWPGPRG